MSQHEIIKEATEFQKLTAYVAEFLQSGLFQFVLGQVAYFQTGKFNMSDSFQDWSCSSACSLPSYCRLPRCTKIRFPETFSGSGKVSVLVIINIYSLFKNIKEQSEREN